jgi:hypothetical protein
VRRGEFCAFGISANKRRYVLGTAQRHHQLTWNSDMRLTRKPLKSALLVGVIALSQTAGLVRAEQTAWWVDLEGGLEYSDNVALEQSDANSMQGDVAAVFTLDAGYRLVDEQDARIEVGYNFHQSVYDDLTAFNWQSHNPSLVAWIRSSGIRYGVEYAYTNSMLDGSFFVEQHMISPTFSTWLTDDIHIAGYYRFYSKNYNKADDARDADTHQVGADVHYYYDRPNRGYVSVGGGFTDEDTDGDAFDYDGFMVRASVQHPVEAFGHKGHIKLSYAHQRRDYSNDASLPGPGTRADDRHTLKFSTQFEVDTDTKIGVEFKRVVRDSNLDGSNYEENVGSVFLRYSL